MWRRLYDNGDGLRVGLRYEDAIGPAKSEKADGG